ncbi:hypothetical protein [Lysinibacillus xylanilyticus]|uniref:hypothetical protein n=1 Tax=Lysinibacillus xylanilyticus TaxID=582475 RepID=UPI003D09098A
MLKNKIISAVITLILGIFIIPLFIEYTYNISYGIYGTAFCTCHAYSCCGISGD